MKFAKRIDNIEESKSVKLASIVGELKSKGIDIIGLHVGEPDFPTPQRIIDATKDALDQNHTRYSFVPGIKELRTGIAEKLIAEHKLDIDFENVFVGNGSKHILYNIFQTLIDDGDEVIVPVPYWVTFPESIKLAGGEPVFVNCEKNQLVISEIEKAITPKTKAIIINSPNNPTGAVYPKEDLEKIVALAKKHDFFIISDEAYELLLFDDLEFSPMASLSKDAFERTITVQSFSKSYCMTGFRLGYMIAPKRVITAVNKLQSHLSGNNCTFSQYGAIEALKMGTSQIEGMIKTFQERRDLAYRLCSEIFEVEKPQGAFYLFPNIDKFLKSGQFKSDTEMAEFILKEAHVAILPGNAFGMDNHIRICFSQSEEEIIQAFANIKKVLCK